jgi:hypothetical protein
MSRGVTKYFGGVRKKRLANLAIAALTIIATLVILITIYGQHVGNFVVAVETASQLALALSETPDFINPTSRLAAKGITDQTNTTYEDIPIERLIEIDGSGNDELGKRYFAYSFYVKNISATPMDYTANIVLNHTTKGADSALRIMVVRDKAEDDIYAKAKETPESEIGKPEDHAGTEIVKNYLTIPFISPILMMEQNEQRFRKDQVRKYTVIMWLEGWDNECTDDILGAVMRLEMRFSAYRI